MTTHPTTNKPKRKSRRYQQRRHKRQFGKEKKKQTLTIETEEKAFQLKSEQILTTIKTKLKQQFCFVADPKKTLLHNASSALANTPTWYYFSRPSPLTFHDFTQQKQPPKNLRSLLGLGLKFIPIPHLTNIWNKLEKQQYPTSNALSIYASTSPEVQTPPMNRTTQKCMYSPIGRLHTGRNHPSSWTNALKISRPNWINYSKYELESQTYSHIRHALYKKLQQHQDFLICPSDKNLGPAIIEHDNYIKIAMRDHLLDGRTYRPLSTADCANHKQ